MKMYHLFMLITAIIWPALDRIANEAGDATKERVIARI